MYHQIGPLDKLDLQIELENFLVCSSPGNLQFDFSKSSPPFLNSEVIVQTSGIKILSDFEYAKLYIFSNFLYDEFRLSLSSIERQFIFVLNHVQPILINGFNSHQHPTLLLNASELQINLPKAIQNQYCNWNVLICRNKPFIPRPFKKEITNDRPTI